MNKCRGCSLLVSVFALTSIFAQSTPVGAPRMLLLDPMRDARAAREVCNPVDPLVMWDVIFSSVEIDAGCKSFTATDLVAGLKFMVVQGEHSLTVRYPETHPPVVTGAYDRVEHGVSLRCVTVSMPDGLMLQERIRETTTSVEEAQQHQVLYCRNSTRCTQGDNGECCCSSPTCNCFMCYCASGCADCTCDGEDGGFWPADPDIIHPHLNYNRSRGATRGHARLQAGARADD